MKRTVYFILTIIMCFSSICIIPACNKKPNENFTTTKTSSVTESNILSTTKTSIQHTVANDGDIGGGVLSVPKYRAMFYSVPAPFVNLIGKELFFEWRETIDATSTAETMVMSQFVQHFGITREQFDKANLEWAKGIRDNLGGVPCINPKDYANQITDEVFNADIIFTFDDDLIREYYLSPDYPYLYDVEFEEAVTNGEYTPRTEEWVDIEQMEAEIIAKYGEAEIVTTVAAEEIPIEETTVEESTEALNDIPETTVPET